MGRDDNIDSLGKMVDRLLPHPVAMESFYLGETEVTNREFAAFVAQNPQWSPANTATLVANGQANDSYLSDWVNARPLAGTEDLPVTSVSFFAATAYCDWLTRSVQAVLPGYVARLPYESEWEWAARGGLRGVPFPLGEKPGAAVFYHKGIVGPSRAGASEPNGYGLRDMAGNVWQWCLDPYAPSSYLVSSLDPALNASYEKAYAPGSDRVVRGGSWNNQSEHLLVIGGASYFISGILVAATPAGTGGCTTAQAPGSGACQMNLPNPTTITLTSGSAYPIKVVLADGGVFSYSAIYGQSS